MVNEGVAGSSFVVPVELSGRGYLIEIGENLIDAKLEVPVSGTSALIVTNTTVSALYADLFESFLFRRYGKVFRCVLPDGECFKNWETLQLIFDALLTNGCDRHSVIYALGGGVVGDMAGFAAACYMRGVPFVQVPTTLLAQVDSSVGGKTGINHPLGKNMVGAFYQPQSVMCELSFLRTLPHRELSAGIAEIIKYGPIVDTLFLEWVENHIEDLLARDMSALAYAVKRCCEIKAWVVAQDERESGLRAILNFGHTFGHAIETGLGYGQWLHGEAVGCGMVMAARLSCALGLIEQDYVDRLIRLIKRARLPVTAPVLNPENNTERYLELMRHDKKAQHGEIRFVLIDGKGNAMLRSAPDSMVARVIAQSCV